MNPARRRLLQAGAGLIVAGCGGGGGGGTQYIGGPPPTALRHDILFGYYGDDAAQAAEVAGHTNLYWASHWDGLGAQITNLGRARAAGLTKVVLMMEGQDPAGPAQAVARVRDWMLALRDARALEGLDVAALYWRDEPNNPDPAFGGELSDAYVRAVNLGIREMLDRVMPELRGAALAAIFAGGSPARPGLEAGADPAGAFDWVGPDHYNLGCGVLGPVQRDIAERKKPGARDLIVPGGAFGQDPRCFEDYAHAHPDVVAIVAFIWKDRWDTKNPSRPGIRGIPEIRALYEAMGKRLTGKT